MKIGYWKSYQKKPKSGRRQGFQKRKYSREWCVCCWMRSTWHPQDHVRRGKRRRVIISHCNYQKWIKFHLIPRYIYIYFRFKYAFAAVGNILEHETATYGLCPRPLDVMYDIACKLRKPLEAFIYGIYTLYILKQMFFFKESFPYFEGNRQQVCSYYLSCVRP
jgi:hypothetical protein